MFIILIICLVTIIYIYLKYIYSYWTRNGFNEIKPDIPWGNLKSVKTQEKSFGTTIYDLYKEPGVGNEAVVGIYLFYRPALLIRDANLAYDIQTKYFNNFHDRGIYVDENDEKSENLFALQGQKWRNLRAKLTPAFSSGKLKNMFTTIKDVGITLQQHIDSIVPENGSVTIELNNIALRYAVDIIGSTIFGLEINSFKEPTNDFYSIHGKITKKSFLNSLRTLSVFLIPSLAKFLEKISGPDEINEFMTAVVKQTIEYREQNNVKRKDLMQSLIELRNTGMINLDNSLWDIETPSEPFKSMSITQVAAHAFLFYIAGAETTKGTVGYCLYELSQNELALKNVLADINKTLQKHDGQITYESIQDMKYLDYCVSETTRKYPGLPILNRECTKDFDLPGTKNKILKGTPIIISTMGIHRDSKYFQNPLKFIPERFQEGHEDRSHNDKHFIPFGEGPRQCIALRMGKISAKLGIVMILTKFNIETATKGEIEFDDSSVGLIPKHGINIKFSRKI